MTEGLIALALIVFVIYGSFTIFNLRGRRKMFKALSILYIGIWLILTTGYVGKDYLGGTYSASLPFSILVFIALPFILGYLTRMEGEDEKTDLD